MNLKEFEGELEAACDGTSLEDFCQRHILHGTPYVFRGRDSEYFSFKKRICENYGVKHNDVFIVGSGKLGFSPFKKTEFSLDSDIDIAIVSADLARNVDELGLKFEYSLRSAEAFLTSDQKRKYFEYLRYRAIGWMRPDLIPHRSPMKDFREAWFDFFNSLSHGRSEVGNYKVTAGLFHSIQHLEEYTKDSMRKIRRTLEVDTQQ